MTIKENNQSKKWIIEAFFELLKTKDYHDITVSNIVDKAGLGRRTFYRHFESKDDVIKYTMKLLMSDFAYAIKKNHANTQEEIIKSFFEFWEDDIDILLLYKKTHLLYYFEDHLLAYIYSAALESGHIPHQLSQDEAVLYYEKYKYEFAVKLGGLWKATLLWCSETPRKTPAEISKVITSML